MVRVIDGPCPVCNFPKENIKLINDKYICESCGYDESMQAKFPSHQE